MKLISVNVAQPREIRIHDQLVSTGIFKQAVSGPVRVRTLNLDGDRQADLRVHGGPDKAVYVYPSEHYAFWQRELVEDPLPWGAFGENLTVEGITEDKVCIGDEMGIGTAVFQVTQPRQPCFKLAAKFQRDDMIKRFLDSRRTGFYFRVLKEGSLQAGDSITILHSDAHQVSVREMMDLLLLKHPKPSLIERALSVEPLSKSWREHFQKLLTSR